MTNKDDFDLVKNAATAASKSLRRTDDIWEEIPVSLFLELDKFQRSLDRKIFEKMEDRFKGIESEE